MDDQHAGLDVLADIIRRQKGMGQDIFREVTQQNDLIDEIDDRAENVNQRLLDTTSSVRVVSRKDRTCGYWVVILILFIAILAVLIWRNVNSFHLQLSQHDKFSYILIIYLY